MGRARLVGRGDPVFEVPTVNTAPVGILRVAGDSYALQDGVSPRRAVPASRDLRPRPIVHLNIRAFGKN